MLAFTTILATAIAAYFAAPWWVIGVGAGVLAGISVVEHRGERSRLATSGLGAMAAREAVAYSVLHATAAAVSAYGLGAVTRLTLTV